MPHYRIIRRLAIGGMAEVFLGKVVGTAGFEKPVAIKRMLPSVAADPGNVESFLREARLCVHLVHPHVVQVLDLGLTSGQPYLVMELVDGEDLRQVMAAAHRAGQPLRPPEAIYIASRVAEALAYAHEAPGPDGRPLEVVHRDVNPSNVLVSMRGEVKLADFGVAKAADGSQATHGNLLKGKIGYLAPELLAGNPATHASDIFLAGTLLWELLAGRPLFGGGTSGRVLAAIQAHDERRLEAPPGTPDELLPVLRRALARSPDARHPHARDLADELRQVLENRRVRLGPEELARRMAALFPGRLPLDRNLGDGTPLRDDRHPAPEVRTPVARVAVTPGVPGNPAPSPFPPSAAAPPGREVEARGGRRRRLGELLLEAGLLTPAQLQTVLARQRLEGGRLGEWVVSLEYAPARSVLQVLARQLGVPFVTDEKLLDARPPAELLARVPQELALRLLAVPLSVREGSTFVAMTDPADLARLDLLRFRLGPKVRPVVATEFGVRRAIALVYGGRADDLRWRQLDPADPRSMLAGRMIDFEALERERSERESLARAWGAAGTPPPASPLPVPVAGYQTPPAFVHGGYAHPAGTPALPPGYPVAYVPAGVGPDGQPIYVAVPAPAAVVAPGAEGPTPVPGPGAAEGGALPTPGAPSAAGPAQDPIPGPARSAEPTLPVVEGIPSSLADPALEEGLPRALEVSPLEEGDLPAEAGPAPAVAPGR